MFINIYVFNKKSQKGIFWLIGPAISDQNRLLSLLCGPVSYFGEMTKKPTNNNLYASQYMQFLDSFTQKYMINNKDCRGYKNTNLNGIEILWKKEHFDCLMQDCPKCI